MSQSTSFVAAEPRRTVGKPLLRVDSQVGGAALAAWDRGVDALLAEQMAPVTARREWLTTWAAYRSDWEPWAVVVRTGAGAARAEAAAFFARRRRHGVAEVVGLGHRHCDAFRLPARHEPAATALADAVAAGLGALRGPWRLRVEQLPVGDLAASVLRDRLRHGALVPGDAAPQIAFSAGRTADAYASTQYRKQVRRMWRRAEREGLRPTVEFARRPDDVAGLLDELEALRRRRDHALGRPSEVDTAAGRAFWHATIARLAEMGQAEVATLRLGDEVATFEVCLLDGDALRTWDHRIEPRFAPWQPGQLLDWAVLERALADPAIGRIDLMRGTSAYKLRLANDEVAAQHLVAWSSAGLRAADLAGARAHARAKAELHARPGLRAAWRRAKGTALAWRAAR